MAPSAVNILEESTTLDNQSKGNIIRANGSSEFSSSAGVATGKRLISQAMKQRIQEIDQDVCEAGEEDTFFVADMGDVYRQHLRWKMNLSRVKPHYGEKQIFSLFIQS
jgi:ornithine decarboxylase